MNAIFGILAAVVFVGALWHFVGLRSDAPDAPLGAGVTVGTEQAKMTVREEAEKTIKQAPKDNSMTNEAMTQNVSSELGIEILAEGAGERKTQNGDMIAVHYTGTLTDGTKFDSSVDRGEPFEFELGAGMVIRGWDEGLVGMKIGEKRNLTIPASMGYGSRGVGSIPPNATLLFEVELLAIK